VGTVVSGSLEQSNVELSEQLTDLIVAQRAYQANTRVISTSDELLEQLNNL
jgi:flagellar hook protein FlgE